MLLYKCNIYTMNMGLDTFKNCIHTAVLFGSAIMGSIGTNCSAQNFWSWIAIQIS